MSKCVMFCGRESLYIDLKTNEGLCDSCAGVNESIYRSRGERGKYKKENEKI
ncbi:hypothetical protein LCGC14_0687950 [marine sediment metagenome]|uniref:Uncharacterized protein n=1 Tax=marine sediment metagenome TaxID=412755 RepID=A0A0F9QR75_9ZZZZ